MRKVSKNRNEVSLFGGPWHDRVALIPSRGTFKFKVGQYIGFYDRDGWWHGEKHERK